MTLPVMDYRFQSVETLRDLQKGMNFIHSQDLGYPGYHDWGERAKPEIAVGKKDMILITHRGQIIGDFIGQPHKVLGASGIYEIKNIRIHPDWRGRDLSRPLLRHVELGARLRGFQALIADYRADQMKIGNFLYAFGYVPVLSLPLYGDGNNDQVMVKFLHQQNRGFVQGLTKRIITTTEIQAAHN